MRIIIIQYIFNAYKEFDCGLIHSTKPLDDCPSVIKLKGTKV